MSGMYYLNNSGSRWLYRPNDIEFFIIHDATRSCVLIKRKPIFFEAFGNFAAIYYMYNGKRYRSVTFSDKLEDVDWRAKSVSM